jgi:protein arginine kinase activator
MKCDNCSKQATVHLTEIHGGKKVEKHLCEQCAAKLEGLQSKAHTPINELLTSFVLAHSGAQKDQQISNCEQCGMTWAEFRQNGLLGCAADYDLFERDLAPLIQRAHEGATHHVGKTPVSHGGSSAGLRQQFDLTRLRKELQRAVEQEDYEQAAKLRDQIKQTERGGETGAGE